MVVWAGGLMIGISVVHALFGIAIGWSVLAEIASEGLFDSVGANRDRGHVFWFLFASPMLGMVGGLVCWIGSRGLIPPRWLAASLAALFVLAAAVMPVSGVWLLLCPIALLFAATRRGANGAAA